MKPDTGSGARGAVPDFNGAICGSPRGPQLNQRSSQLDLDRLHFSFKTIMISEPTVFSARDYEESNVTKEHTGRAEQLFAASPNESKDDIRPDFQEDRPSASHRAQEAA